MSALPFWEQPKGNILVLFDVDGTLTPARRMISKEMQSLLRQLREKVVIGFVGGSDLEKQKEQLGLDGADVLKEFDYCFPENGVIAYEKGKLFASQSFIEWIGEDKYQQLVNFMLRYMSELQLPMKRGTFIEFRRSMINVSPVGRNTTTEERDAYEAFDKAHKTRAVFVQALRDVFPDMGLTYSIGGQISFDVFPTGWDKTYCLRHVENEDFKEIHFFGDKAFEGGNDWEIYNDPRIIGHAVTSPEDTMKLCRELFLKD